MKARLLKKPIALMMMVLLLFAYATVLPVYAAGAPTGTLKVTADKTTVNPGDTINVKVETGDTKFESLSLQFNFDPTQVDFISCTTQLSGMAFANHPDGKPYVRLTSSNIIAVAAPNGEAMTMVFKIKDGVTGKINFTPSVEVWSTTNPDDAKHPLKITATIDDSQEIISKLNTDISSLAPIIADAKSKNAADYTESSFAVLTEKLKAAEAITSESTPEALATAKTDLQSAIDGLKKAVDKSALQAAVNAVPAGFETTYTPQTAKGVTDALSTANALLNNKNLEDTQENQKAIADAATAVNNAVKALVAIPNKDTLKTKLDAANAMIGDTTVTYMDVDKAALQGKIDAAQTVYQDVNASESDVSGAISGLDTAMAAMRKAADKAGFKQAVADYQTKYQQTDYTPASWKDMQTALDAAAAMSQKLDAGQVPATEADAVLAQLEKAANGLVKAPTAQEKENLKNALTLLNEPDYTPETWMVYKSAFDAANTVYKDIDNRSQAEVNGALSTLNQGIAQLITTTEDPDSKVIVHGLEPGQKINVTDQSKDKDTVAAFEKAMAQKSEFTSGKNSKILFLSDITPVGDFTTGKATIFLPVTGDYDAYYVGHKKADDSIEWFGPLTPKDGYVSLEVTGFSDYVLVGVKNAEAVTPGTTSDNASTSATGGSSNANTGISGSNDVNLYAALAFIGGALALTGFELYRAKRKEI